MARKTSTEQFMRSYGALMNAGIQSGAPEAEALGALFADYVVASSPAGVMGSQGGADFSSMVADGIQNYRKMGGTSFIVETVAVTAIDDLHDLARVGWKFDYRHPVTGHEDTIRFENVYFVSQAGNRPKIFAWVTPDEHAALKAHNLA